MFIVAITGYSESGKDFVADHFVKHHSFKKYALATTIKQMVANQNNLTLADIEKLKNDPTTTIRQQLQFVGQDHIKTHGPAYWVEQTVKRIYQNNEPENQCLVLSDVRNIYEYIALCQEFERENVILVYVNKPALDLSKPKYQHETELSVKLLYSLADYVFTNNVQVSPDELNALFNPLEVLYDSVTRYNKAPQVYIKASKCLAVLKGQL